MNKINRIMLGLFFTIGIFTAPAQALDKPSEKNLRLCETLNTELFKDKCYLSIMDQIKNIDPPYLAEAMTKRYRAQTDYVMGLWQKCGCDLVPECDEARNETKTLLNDLRNEYDIDTSCIPDVYGIE